MTCKLCQCSKCVKDNENFKRKHDVKDNLDLMTLTQKRVVLMKFADEMGVWIVVIVADGNGTIEMGSNLSKSSVQMLLEDAVHMAEKDAITEAIDGMDVAGDA